MKKVDADEIWIDPITITDKNKSDIARILNTDVNDARLEYIYIAISRASDYQMSVNHRSTFKPTKTEQKNQLKALELSLAKAKTIIEGLDYKNECLLDQSHYLANNADPSFVDHSRKETEDSAFLFNIKKMVNAVNYFQQGISPGKNADSSYNYSIRLIGDAFTSEFPEHSLPRNKTISDEMIFSKLIRFWLTTYFGKKDTSPRAKIEAAYREE